MANKGGGKHQKRLSKPKVIPITDKKSKTWIIKQQTGPHARESSMPLVVLLREVLGVAKTSREARNILNNRLVEVDGKVRTKEDFPIGIMDVIGFPKADKYYRLVVDWKGRLRPIDIDKAKAGKKILKVLDKHISPGTKISLTFHDGRNMLSDNHIRVGDSVLVSLPEAKLVSHLKLAPGCRCLIREGKHAGSIVSLDEIIPRKAGKPNEAKVTGEDGQFTTVAKYLFVVGNEFEVSG